MLAEDAGVCQQTVSNLLSARDGFRNEVFPRAAARGEFSAGESRR